jgi:uncharacterized membrane protein required for colicin V production
MGGIEVLAFVVVFIFGTIGLVRGPAKELGVTLALVVLLAALAQFNGLIGFEALPGRVNSSLSALGLDSADVRKQQTMVVFIFAAITVFTAFMAYHGVDTLAFKFRNPPGVLGSVMGFLVGALNGYLLVGTIWYYLARFDYPIQTYPWFQATFTPLAQDLVGFLPQNLFSTLMLSVGALAMLWWRIAR